MRKFNKLKPISYEINTFYKNRPARPFRYFLSKRPAKPAFLNIFIVFAGNFI